MCTFSRIYALQSRRRSVQPYYHVQRSLLLRLRRDWKRSSNYVTKRVISTSALLVMPRCGHTMNIEDPDAFNRAVLDFITWVDAGRWWERNPETLSGAIIAGKAKD